MKIQSFFKSVEYNVVPEMSAGIVSGKLKRGTLHMNRKYLSWLTQLWKRFTA
jgi:hypothetical protein